MTKPEINVTPLIDVLLVLLIIFMVVTPMKPSAFDARIPSEPTDDPRVRADPRTIVVVIGRDSSFRINHERIEGSVDEPRALIQKLSGYFEERERAYSSTQPGAADAAGQIERTVFIKAPRALTYGSVAKVVDAVKSSGARPISLQIDDLE